MDKSFSIIIVLSVAQFLCCHAGVYTVSRTSTERETNKATITNVVRANWTDIAHALHYTLHKEIPRSGSIIRGAKMDALQKYLNATSSFLTRGRSLFQILFLVFGSSTEITIAEFKETIGSEESAMHTWQDVDLNQWVDCKGTSPEYRGYPCGLWRLFHTLTLWGAYSERVGALDGILAYVKEFFGCGPCKAHFLHMAERDNILASNSASTQALWLWKAHNEVNMRIKGDATEDPGYPKENYPNKSQCPDCFDANDNYVEAKVLDYLMRIYARPRTWAANVGVGRKNSIVKSSTRYHRYPWRNDNHNQAGFVQSRSHWSRY